MNKLQYLNIKSLKDDRKINQAAKVLNAGGIVALPTETVYGLFVNALNKESVNNLFKLKGRNLQKALTYHLWGAHGIRNLALEIPPYCENLFKKFLPGPLMMLFKKQKRVPDNITGSSNKVGVRIPDNEITLEILKRAGVPVAGSSANLSGGLSSTRPEHVLASFADAAQRIDVLVETEKQPIGIESTILDVSVRVPRILRMGFITPDQIYQAAKIKPVLSANKEGEAGFPEFKPGGKVVLFEGYTRAIIPKMKEIIEKNKEKKILLVLTNETAAQFEGDIITMGSITSFEEIAKNIFGVLRTMEIKEADMILVEGILPANIGAAVMDKLRKAANEVVYAR